MFKIFYRIAALFLLLIFSSCADLVVSPFTVEKIDKLRIGMSASEVRELFGAPTEVSTTTCGGATKSGPWVCETWKYRSVNTFTFEVTQNVKSLANWNVKRELIF